MQMMHGRDLVALSTLITCVLSGCPSAFALNPALDISQYVHTSWKIRDGFTRGAIQTIAQTADGYLWLGTEFGIFRFDGVRAVPWQPPLEQQLPSSNILSLLVARDGTLWIGTDRGLATWKDGKLTRYEELTGSHFGMLVEDRQGSIWTLRAASTRTLCSIRNGRVQCHGKDGGPGAGALGLYEDSKGNLWVGTRTGLWRWQPDPAKFYPLPLEENGIRGFAEDDDGTLLISQGGGIRRFLSGKAEMMHSFPPSMQPRKLLRDRDGGLWIGSSNGGLAHIHQGIADVFAQLDGLSGNTISALFEDRERNIWVATTDGLDRFRDAAAASFSVNQGLSNAGITSVLTSGEGSVWVGTNNGLNRWKDGQVTVYRERSGSATLSSSPHVSRKVHEVTGRGMPAGGVTSIFQDSHGRVWVSTHRGVGFLENDRFVPLGAVPGGLTRAIVEDTRGNLWIANPDSGLFRVAPRSRGIEQILWTRLNRNDPVTAMAADPLKGGPWLGFYQGGIGYFADGQLRALYGAADGLADGRVSALQPGRDGTLWVATAGGLSRLKNGRVATLTSRNGLPCDSVGWIVEDDADSLWLGMPCGLVRLAREEIDAWAAANKQRGDTDARRRVQVTVFDNTDGVRIPANASYYTAPAAKASDGKVWFVSRDGVTVVDPRHLPFNSVPPPVHIEEVIADRKTYDVPAIATGQVSLPALTRDLQIDYTALSLVTPEKNRFRIKLEGWDRNWQDVGTRRQAFYTNLPPRSYRFRVIASNNSGVWNEAGASLSFTVLPTYYQTTWFGLSTIAVFIASVVALYQLRVRRLARQFNVSLEARVNERTRIARDLHDTLLQNFQGVLLNFQAATFQLPNRPAHAQKTLDDAIERASQAITEARDAVQGLRASTTVKSDLARAIGTLGEDLTDRSEHRAPEFSVEVEGTPRDLAPILGDEVYRIAGEALRNAFRHAQARRIEAEIHYDRREFRLRIRDDGKGIDPHVLDGGGRIGHYGLAGMHERAAVAGGTLSIWSERDSGTEIELTIPAAVAYSRTERPS